MTRPVRTLEPVEADKSRLPIVRLVVYENWNVAHIIKQGGWISWPVSGKGAQPMTEFAFAETPKTFPIMVA